MLKAIVSADIDFGMLLARRKSNKPSVVIFRRSSGRRPEAQTELLLRNLPQVEDYLEAGSVVVIEESRVRVRRLPVSRAE